MLALVPLDPSIINMAAEYEALIGGLSFALGELNVNVRSLAVAPLYRRMNDALGITSIVVSHDVAEVSTVADRSYLISDGKVAASGSPDELSAAKSELVRQFMHGMADGPVAFHFEAPDYAEQLLGRDTE